MKKILLTTNLLIKKWDSFNGPLEIKGIQFPHETTIIEKQVENLIKASIKINKEASIKLNKDIMFPTSKSIFWKYSVTIQ